MPETADDPQVAARLRALLVTRGGFTLDARRGRPVAVGYAVAVEPARSLTFLLSDWDDRVVGDWVRAARAHAAARPGPRLHLGGWHRPGPDRVHLDLVHVLPPARPQLALWTARRHHQRAVFDLARGALVPLSVP